MVTSTIYSCHIRKISLLILAVTLTVPYRAKAQMVDYGSLQNLFGEPVTTSATGTPQRVSDVPVNMTIITADEIRQSGSRNVPQIVGEYVPGIDVVQESINNFDVGVRGYQQAYQPRLLVLLDGRQVFDDDYSRTIWDDIPVNIDDIRQIEVVKGASSALFGSNAAGGVINIVTYSPIYDKNNVANVSIGTQQSLTGDATVTTNGNWGGTKISVGGMSADEFSTPRIPSDDQIPTYKPQHQYVVSSSVFQLAPKLQVSTEATYSNSTDNSIDGISDVMAAQKTTSYSLRAGASWQSPYGLISSDNYYNYIFNDFFEPEDGGAPYELKTALFVSQLTDQFKIGAHNTFRLGLEYRYKDFVNTGDQIIQQAPDLAENNYAVSGAWMWRVNNKLSWTNALRVEQQSMTENGTLSPLDVSTYADYSHVNNVWSANSDLVYKATDIDTVRFGYGRGIQLPSLIESGYNQIFNFDGAPADFEGNPRLKPTIVQDLGLDLDHKFTSIFSTLKLSTYYEYNQDIADFVVPGVQASTGYTFFTAQNIGNSQGWGGEIQLKGNHEGFRWNASYSYARAADSEGVAEHLSYETSAPAHHFRLLLGYTHDAWEFDANGQYVTSTALPRSLDGGDTSIFVPAGPYYNVGARIGYKLTDNITAALSGANLTYAQTVESPYPAIQRQIFLNLTVKF